MTARGDDFDKAGPGPPDPSSALALEAAWAGGDNRLRTPPHQLFAPHRDDYAGPPSSAPFIPCKCRASRG